MNETLTVECVMVGCGTFDITPDDQAFYKNLGYDLPKRCQKHRLERRREKERKEKSPFHPNNWQK